jgi:SAM-dependent methyltransferase
VFMHHDLTEPLPFLAGSFDVAVCRFALHHLQHPGLAVAEMARVLRPGGHAALVDMIAAPNATVAAQQDRIETLRDPSHTRMFSGEGLRELAAGHGLEVVAFDAHPVQRPVGPWLEQAQTPAGPAADIESELLAEARRGGTPTGMSPELRDGELWFTQTFASLIAQAR